MNWKAAWRHLGCAGLVAGVVTGCTSGATIEARTDTANAIARTAGLHRQSLSAGVFGLTAYVRLTSPADPLVVYIEGDGQAWITRTRISSDPTPRDPVALRLAAVDPSPNVAYLARPCQYAAQPLTATCTAKYWTSHRFSEDVVASTSLAIDGLQHGTSGGVHLVGFSGGGAVAALVAQRRTDVLSLRTVAGTLDLATFTEYHKVSPLTGSLDPLAGAPMMRTLPQRHLVGGQDTVIPRLVVDSFARAVGPTRCLTVVTVPMAAHGEGWLAAWAAEVRHLPAC